MNNLIPNEMQKQPVERIINKATKFLVSGIPLEEQDDILN